MRFSYFDLSTRTYKTISSAVVDNVLEGPNDTRIVEKTNLKIEISSLEQFKFIS
jgi:hypothetical protein